MTAKQEALDALTAAANTSSTTTKALHVQTAQVHATLALADAIEAAGRRNAAAMVAGGLR